MSSYIDDVKTSDTKVILFNEQIHEFLMRIGLTKDERWVYELLLDTKIKQGLSAGSIARSLGRTPNAMYRLLYKLEVHGLVYRVVGRPMRFYAKPVESGLAATYVNFTNDLRGLLEAATGNKTSGQQTEIVVGREALYQKYIELARMATKSVDIFAIGIAYSKGLETVQRDLIARGVRVRHVAQEQRLSNYRVLYTWKKLGVDIRTLPTERGFHVMLFDASTVIMTFSAVDDTEDRVSLILRSTAIVSLMGSYFEQVWHASQPIKSL